MRHAESRKNDEEMSGGNASDRKDMVLNLQARRREVRTSIVCRESQVIPRSRNERFHVFYMENIDAHIWISILNRVVNT